MNQSGLDQKFGSQNASEFKKWQEELKNGSSEAMSKEIEELKEDLEKLAKTDDPVKRTEMERKVEKRLKALADFAGEKSGSKSLQAALQRAKEQMEAAKSGKPLSTEAMEAMQETMDLAKMELQQLAQSANDLKSLEQAMETIAAAKQLNKDGQLDGAMSDALTAMEEYKELYEELLAMAGEGEGEGEGEGDGEGEESTDDSERGQGGDAEEEDDSVKTDFVSEHTKTPIQQGKILLSMKQKGLSESGEAKQNFQRALSEVKQGFSEAIEAEQIPPGYHEGIKTYFDSLDVPAATESPSTETPASKP
jgi:hypothetical protein